MSARSSFKCNFACKQCEESPAKNPSVKLHLDHIIPWNKGGETTFEPHQLNNKLNTTNKWLKTHYGAAENTFVHFKYFLKISLIPARKGFKKIANIIKLIIFLLIHHDETVLLSKNWQFLTKITGLAMR